MRAPDGLDMSKTQLSTGVNTTAGRALALPAASGLAALTVLTMAMSGVKLNARLSERLASLVANVETSAGLIAREA